MGGQFGQIGQKLLKNYKIDVFELKQGGGGGNWGTSQFLGGAGIPLPLAKILVELINTLAQSF